MFPKKLSNEEFYSLLALTALLLVVYKDQVSDFLSSLCGGSSSEKFGDGEPDTSPSPSSWGMAQITIVSVASLGLLLTLVFGAMGMRKH